MQPKKRRVVRDGMRFKVQNAGCTTGKMNPNGDDVNKVPVRNIWVQKQGSTSVKMVGVLLQTAEHLVATVDYLSKKNDIPLCDKFSELRKIKLEQPYFVGDPSFLRSSGEKCIDEYLRYNIYEGDLYDAV